MMSEGGRRGGGARQRAADSGYIPVAAASATQTRARPLNITILEDCWDAITTLESDRDKNDLWRTLRKAAKRGDTGREFELEVVRALLSDNEEVHCIMRTAVVDWSSDMDTRDADGGHFPLEALLGAEGGAWTAGHVRAAGLVVYGTRGANKRSALRALAVKTR